MKVGSAWGPRLFEDARGAAFEGKRLLILDFVLEPEAGRTPLLRTMQIALPLYSDVSVRTHVLV